MMIVNHYDIYRRLMHQVEDAYLRYFKYNRKKTLSNLYGLLNHPTRKEVSAFWEELIMSDDKCVYCTYEAILNTCTTYSDLQNFLDSVKLTDKEFLRYTCPDDSRIAKLQGILSNVLFELSYRKVQSLWKFNKIKKIPINKYSV